MFLISDDFWQIAEAGKKGLGVFAKKEIGQGTIIGDYLGKLIKTAEYDLELDKKGLFLMYFSNQASIYPNLDESGIHFFNHSCAPNCWIYVHRGHTLFFALRNIEAGEELTISYLLSPKDDCFDCTHVCRCGSKFCSGTMHLSREKYEMWQEFQNKVKKKTRRTKVVFGKNLQKLTSYPRINFKDPIYSIIASH